MTALILIIFAVIFIAVIAVISSTDSVNKNSDSSSEIEIVFHETPDPDGEPFSKFYCYIAGLSYHQESIQLGGFVGYGIWDRQNAYDKLAIAIYNSNGKLYGYVPKEMHKEYLSYFPDKAPAFIVGYVEIDADRTLHGKAYFVRNHSWEYAKYEISDLIKWVRKNKNVEMQEGYESVLNQIDEQIEQKHKNDTNMI